MTACMGGGNAISGLLTFFGHLHSEGIAQPHGDIIMISMGHRPNQAVTRVMLVDDHSILRRGIRALIEGEPGWEVCAEADNGHQAQKMVKDIQPDIIVMDLSMPQIGGIDATSQIRKIVPNVEILILTMHESDEFVAQALRAGARGYLLKNESGEKLMDALKALSRHQPYFSPGVSETLLKGYLGTGSTPAGPLLTPRERQIVKLVAEGNTNKRIAIILGVSIKTVETHRSAAMNKTGAKSSADLTLYAARNDLVQL